MKTNYRLYYIVILCFLLPTFAWADCLKGNCIDNYGIYSWPDGSRYEGEYRGSLQHGKGTYTWADGNKYEGEYRDNIQHGKGIFTWADGSRYEGEYDNGIQHGKGIFIWPNGNRYEGEYTDGVQHGKGIFTWADGNRYEGEYADGMQHGKGIFIWPNGNKYEGEYKNGRQFGKGTTNYADGNKYTGEYKNGKKHGFGTFTWADGSKYEGEYKNDQQHGQGTFIWADETKYAGAYRNGKQHGKGTFTWSNGNKYVGEYRNGEKYGQGTSYSADGSVLGGNKLSAENLLVIPAAKIAKADTKPADNHIIRSGADSGKPNNQAKKKPLIQKAEIKTAAKIKVENTSVQKQENKIPAPSVQSIKTDTKPLENPVITSNINTSTNTAKLYIEQASIKRKRTALIIGNANYKRSPLKNPLNDARDMAQALKQSNFSVILRLDVDQEQIEVAINDFGRQITQGGIGLFYYAGHGVQVNGHNYLIPINANIKRQKDVRYKAVDLNQVLDEMSYARNGLNVAILDACRDNPLPRSFRSTGSGLARTDGPKGTLIAFATSPGSVAIDGEGNNGVFTKHLLKNINIQGLSIEQVFKNVLKGVNNETRGEQTPWMSSSFTGDFYFLP